MSLVDYTYFVGEINLPGLSDDDTQARLALFITRYEKKFLTDLLGHQLYSDFIAGLAVTPTVDPKWTKLRDGGTYTYNGKTVIWDGLRNSTTKESIIANYVYYWWQRNEVSQTTGIGEVATKGENSSRVTPAAKMTRAWNEMATEIWKAVSFLDTNITDYPGWSWYGDTNGEYWMNYNNARLKDIFYPINSFNL